MGLFDYALGGYRTARNAIRAGTSLQTRQKIINTLRLQPLLSAEKAVGGFISDTKRPLQYDFGTKVAGVSVGTGNPTDVSAPDAASVLGNLGTAPQPTRSRTVTGTGAAISGAAAEEAKALEEENTYRRGLINTKYDRLTEALRKRRGQTEQSYETAKGDVSESLTEAQATGQKRKEDVDAEFERVVEEGRIKRDKLQGSIAASFAARGLSSSSGATGASTTADETFKTNVSALDDERQEKFTTINEALKKAEQEASKEIARLDSEKTSALEDIDSDLTLSEEERSAALHDLNVNYQTAVKSLNEQLASAQAKRVALAEAAESEATFTRVQTLNENLTSAFNRLKSAGLKPGDGATAKYVADAYKIPEEYVKEYWSGLDKTATESGLYGPAFFQSQ